MAQAVGDQWTLIEAGNQRRHAEVLEHLSGIAARQNDQERRLVAVETVCGQRQRRASSESKRISEDNARRDRAIDDVRSDMRLMREELRTEMRELRSDVRTSLGEFRNEFTSAEMQFREHEVTGVREVSERAGAAAERNRIFGAAVKIFGLVAALGGTGGLVAWLKGCGG